MKLLAILAIVLCAASSAVEASRLVCIYNWTMAYINPADASITLNDQASIMLELIVSSASDPARNLYMVHGFVDDTNHGIQIFDATSGATIALQQLDEPVDSIYYDQLTQTFYALDFAGVYTIDVKTGQLDLTYPFKPEFEVIYEESMAYDSKRHRLTLFNTSAVPDLLMTIDMITKQSVAQVPLTPQPGQQVSPMLYVPGSADMVIGWADHIFWKVNTTSGVLTNMMESNYVPFDTLSTTVDSNGRFLSFVGTDGKDHCFIITIDMRPTPWQLVYQPLTTPDISSLPTALAYMN